MAEKESEQLEEMKSSEMETEVPVEVEAEGSEAVEESSEEETSAIQQDEDADLENTDDASSAEQIPDSQDAEMEPAAATDEDVVSEAIEVPQDLEEGETVSDSVEAKVETDDDSDRNWFVVHCYSGYENKVRHNLEQRIETMGMKSKIFDVVVPTEEEIEIKDGKRRTVERRVFPGYILVQMIMDEDSWYVVRNTPGVTGFVGMGNEPTPLRPEEVNQIVKRMEAEAPRIKVTYKAGQKVRIIDGPFNDFIGTVSEIDMDRAKVRVMVSFFGRETPVELDFLQVEKA
jgi:transcription termination/antitermination protein NusG